VTWFKVDDHLWSHIKWHRVSPAARGLWATAGSWSADQLTDGHVPREMLGILGGTTRHAQQLVDAGLWERVDDGWQFHEWAADSDGTPRNPTRQEVERDRAAARERQRRAREKATAARVTRDNDRDARGDVPPGSRVSNGPPDPTRPYDSKGGDNSQAAADRPPPPRCADHLDHQGRVPPCPACADARRARGIWAAGHPDQVVSPLDQPLDRQQRADLARAERATLARAQEAPVVLETDGTGPRNARDSLRKRS